MNPCPYSCPSLRLLTLAALLGSAFAAPGARAAEAEPDPRWEAKANGTVSFGTLLRTEAPSPDSYTYITSQVVGGVPAGHMIGVTDSADLNWRKNRPVSTVLKASVDLDLHRGAQGLFVRAGAWRDLTLEQSAVPYGNYPNAYRAGARLQDSGFVAEARFSNVVLRDVYAYGALAPTEGVSGQWRLGRQTLDWGKAVLTGGGIGAAITPLDYAGMFRPGALPEESKLPTAMLAANLEKGPQWGASAFLKLEQRSTVFPGCGSFYDVASLIPAGCNLAAAFGNVSPFPAALGSPLTTVAALSEPALLQSGYYLHRNPDATPNKWGQWGVQLRYRAAPLETEFGLYALRSNSTLPGYRMHMASVPLSTSSPINVATLPANLVGAARIYNYAFNSLRDPQGLTYAVGSADGVRLLGLSFDTRLSPASRWYGELALRQNAQLNWNGNDLLTAALQPAVPSAVLNMARKLGSLPLGSYYDAYDRKRVINASVGLNRVLSGALGAQRLVLVAEAGLSHIADLPDPFLMRYGRPFLYGTAPNYGANGVLTACSEQTTASGMPLGVPGKTCTSDGFFSSTAWGVRLNAAATYAGVVPGATLTPALYVSRDMHGYSYDLNYSQGRTTLRPSVRIDWRGTYYAELQYTHLGGGAYNVLADRSTLALVAGLRF